MLRIKCLSDDAKAPSRATTHAAGYDLYSPCDFTIPPGERLMVPLDIKVAIPEGCYGRIAPRSSLAKNFGIDVLAGVIDSDYRGVVSVILLNTDLKTAFNGKKGARIAQLILEKITTPTVLVYLDEMDFSDTTERGEGGFGSTGL
jgi:dUTP pyrophosphatase